jgi:DNA-binding HxlR family transcriptional regulator
VKYLTYQIYSKKASIQEESNVTEKIHHEACVCPVEGIIDVISKKWALLIVNSLGNNGTLRFGELSEDLRRISPKTLSDTLKKLQAEGLVTREAFPTIPPRVEYSLTKDGLEFREITLPVLKWAARRSPPKGHTPRQA